MKDEQFIRIDRLIPDISIDLKYATENNFVGESFYDSPTAYLRYGTAKRLEVAQKFLRERGRLLKVWDAYRPAKAQFKLWSILPDVTYVADPNKGFSLHTTGSAVDVTLTDLNGNELPMPSEFDDFSERSNRDYSKCPDDVKANALLLEEAMKLAGFVEYFDEWWHYEDPVGYAPKLTLEAEYEE